MLSAAAVNSEELSLLVEVVFFSIDETDVVVDFSVFDVEDIAASVPVFAEVVLTSVVVVTVVLSDVISPPDELLSPLQPVSQIADKE